MDWQQYEKEILDEFNYAYPNALIRSNVTLPGRFSKTDRQIDILIEQGTIDIPLRIVVDAKFYSNKIDVKDVESFLGLLRDVAAHAGVMITTQGYSEAAKERACWDDVDLYLDILNLKELQGLQGPAAIPYSGTHGVCIAAPFGWIIDATRRPGAVAWLYQRGLTYEEAMKQQEFMYLNFWSKEPASSTFDDLLAQQEQRLRDDGAATRLRLIQYPSHTIREYTGFVEFEDFVFFSVLFTPPALGEEKLGEAQIPHPLGVADEGRAG